MTTCECGAPLADGGVLGVYCTNKECPVEAAIVRQVSEAFARHVARPALERIHAICNIIRESTWAGIDEGKSKCRGCPAVIESPYGPGTQGCYLLALEVFNIALHGHPLGPVACRQAPLCANPPPAKEGSDT